MFIVITYSTRFLVYIRLYGKKKNKQKFVRKENFYIFITYKKKFFHFVTKHTHTADNIYNIHTYITTHGVFLSFSYIFLIWKRIFFFFFCSNIRKYNKKKKFKVHLYIYTMLVCILYIYI